MHGIVQQALFRGLEIGDVGEGADEPHHFAVGADDRPRLEREPEIMSFVRAQPEILHQAAAALLDHAVERRRGSGRGRADASTSSHVAAAPSSAPRFRPSSCSVSGW